MTPRNGKTRWRTTSPIANRARCVLAIDGEDSGGPILRGGGSGAVPFHDLHPALEWARSGSMHLSGWPDGAPRLAPGGLAAWARAELQALRRLAPPAPPPRLHGP